MFLAEFIFSYPTNLYPLYDNKSKKSTPKGPNKYKEAFINKASKTQSENAVLPILPRISGVNLKQISSEGRSKIYIVIYFEAVP